MSLSRGRAPFSTISFHSFCAVLRARRAPHQCAPLLSSHRVGRGARKRTPLLCLHDAKRGARKCGLCGSPLLSSHRVERGARKRTPLLCLHDAKRAGLCGLASPAPARPRRAASVRSRAAPSAPGGAARRTHGRPWAVCGGPRAGAERGGGLLAGVQRARDGDAPRWWSRPTIASALAGAADGLGAGSGNKRTSVD